MGGMTPEPGKSRSLSVAVDRSAATARFRVHDLAHRTTRSGDFGIRGYWPDTNDVPLYEVRGGWVEADDLRWLRDQIDSVLADA